MDQRVGDADRELTYIKDSLATIDLRLASKEDRLRKQFTAMESALAASQSQSSSLASALLAAERLSKDLKLGSARAINRAVIRRPLPELR